MFNLHLFHSMKPFTHALRYPVLLMIFCSLVLLCGCGSSDSDSTVDDDVTTTVETDDSDFETPDWTDATHSKGADPDFAEVFNVGVAAEDVEVKRLDFVVTSARWQSMLDDMTTKYGTFGQHSTSVQDTDEDPIFVPADIYYNDIQWYRVGIRFKGNSSLQTSWQQGILKLPFKLDFDEFEDDYPQIDNQRFYGFKKLSLKNNYNDESLMREQVAADVFRDAGVAVSHTAFYALYIDHGDGPEYFGLYTLVEEVDDTVIDTQFTSDKGNLYKPEDGAATFVEDEYDSIAEYFEKKTNEDDEDWSDIEDMFIALHDDTSSAATWRANLEATFDVDAFLKYLAVNGIIQNWDTYGLMAHNYYLYNDPDTAKLVWIPWDNNEALQDGNMGGALDLDFANLNSASWPLIAQLYADDVYRERYDGYLQDVIDDAFATAKIQATYDYYAELIEDYAIAERTGYSFLESTSDFYNAINILKAHAHSRASAVSAYLD
ncbi:CotH protein [Desulfuromusa kysingii]|uniref:CotH protein n=1 Tax=Desulfuromusa kysingii TaxID=37625 RepID=A0A1H4BWP9_9BACT|nr:CotH kinase family protein [Desulfuromusa kysingii]SEA52509.1 CotH protein [Desulfuromusa kysingii]